MTTFQLPGMQRQPISDPNETQAVDTETRYRHLIGQLNPKDEERFRMQYGRHLEGFDGVDGVDGLGAMADEGHYDEDYFPGNVGREIRNLEKSEDVYGSGIFDEMGRQPTVNRNLGVFGAGYSIPGYIGREKLFSPSKEVFDWSNNAEVVVIPGGGLLAIDRGETPPSAQLSPYTPVLAPPQRFAPPYQPSGGPSTMAVPSSTTWYPLAPAPERPVGSRPTWEPPTVKSKPVGHRAPPKRPPALPPRSPRDPRFAAPSGMVGSPLRAGAMVARAQRPSSGVRGVGADDGQSIGIGTMLLAGGLVGAAAALIIGAVKMRKSSNA